MNGISTVTRQIDEELLVSEQSGKAFYTIFGLEAQLNGWGSFEENKKKI